MVRSSAGFSRFVGDQLPIARFFGLIAESCLHIIGFQVCDTRMSVIMERLYDFLGSS
jgi:hypothetical protein